MKIKKDIIILANGDFPKTKRAVDLLSSDKFLLCCDGSAVEATAHGYVPDLIIGDMDSLTDELKDSYKDKIIQIDDQNSSDLSKALNWARDNKVESVTLLGADGGGDDHYLGNLFLILDNSYDFKLKVITNSGQFDIVNNKDFSSYPNQRVSIFCMNKEAKVSSSGLKYELDGYSFDNLYGATLNEATGNSFGVSCDNPDVSILVYRGNEETK